MAEWVGAVVAMRARFAGGFDAAPVKYQNEDPPADPWPPVPAKPWIYFEVIQAQTALRGVGLPGSQTWLTHRPPTLTPLVMDIPVMVQELRQCWPGSTFGRRSGVKSGAE
jgi:hypothetical protein